ncbi:tRNA lysidine(34) synthetase TilS [Arenicella xantha]|uniref:tRNA(Ile)-lysidine synthase n=1 Tax=Arenicella xantha TaxID=644221 RepID=A0A395JMV9_9GAMM|nr:tRNA lysidine(34) synthetase TilS [Arenicella xantha]RBP50934.1 tRNA(Ile)-lysidine synthase [Arenicella xantha]
MTFSISAFEDELFGNLGLARDSHYYVAYSGGIDSTVLLHLMHQLQQRNGFKLTALHVNHNLQERSEFWAEHCLTTCQKLGIDFKHTSLQLENKSEVTARNSRYAWFSKQLDRHSVLLTAHHRQDRAETFLFNLMRGAGSAGLSSMRAVRPFHGAKLARPLLPYDKADLESIAANSGLTWVEDPSNRTNDYSRNTIRHEIIPTLIDFRPDAIQNIARAASNLEQENGLLREVAICDLVEVREHPQHPVDKSYALCVADMMHLTPARQSNVIRFWLKTLQLHTPSRRFLQTLVRAIEVPPASTAVMQEGGQQFRFHSGYMYVMPAIKETPPFGVIDWQNVSQPIDIYASKLRLDARPKLRSLISDDSHALVRLAEKAHVENPKALQGHSLNLKKWMNEIGIPPWRRQAVPLLTVRKAKKDLVLAPVDVHMTNDWVSFDSESIAS